MKRKLKLLRFSMSHQMDCIVGTKRRVDKRKRRGCSRLKNLMSRMEGIKNLCWISRQIKTPRTVEPQSQFGKTIMWTLGRRKKNRKSLFYLTPAKEPKLGPLDSFFLEQLESQSTWPFTSPRRIRRMCRMIKSPPLFPSTQ